MLVVLIGFKAAAVKARPKGEEFVVCQKIVRCFDVIVRRRKRPPFFLFAENKRRASFLNHRDGWTFFRRCVAEGWKTRHAKLARSATVSPCFHISRGVWLFLKQPEFPRGEATCDRRVTSGKNMPAQLWRYGKSDHVLSSDAISF